MAALRLTGCSSRHAPTGIRWIRPNSINIMQNGWLFHVLGNYCFPEVVVTQAGATGQCTGVIPAAAARESLNKV